MSRLPLLHLVAYLGLLALLLVGSLSFIQPAISVSPTEKLDGSLRLVMHLMETRNALARQSHTDAKTALGAARYDEALTRLSQSLALRLTTDEPGVTVLLHTSDEAKAVETQGLPVQARVGDVATAYIPLARLAEVAALPTVLRIQASHRLNPTLDLSVAETGAPQVWTNQGNRGQGALIGVIDTGIDPFHPDFVSPTGTTRLKALLDLSDPGDPDSDGQRNGPVLGGTAYTESEINAALANPGMYVRSAEAARTIPDLGSITSHLSVTQAASITSVVVDLHIFHDYIGDLRVTLRCPSGTTATLHDRSGGNRDDIIGTFRVTACEGQNAQGEWQLAISDNAGADVGSLDFWALHINQTVRMTDAVGHGTHVTGIAAGNGRGTANGQPTGRYMGMAPEAGIIAVRGVDDFIGGFSQADVVNALSFIDQKAGELGRPYVVNLSLGGHFGSHDGTSLEERAIDNLTGVGKAGKVVVVSAGNEGQRGIHASGLVTAGGEATLSVQMTDGGALFGAEIWYAGSDTFGIGFRTPNGASLNPVSVPPGADNCYNDSNYDWITCITHTSNNPYNGDKSLRIIALAYVPGTWEIILRGNTVADGRYHAWLATASPSTMRWATPDESVLVGMPGTARNAITVGAYMTRNQWQDTTGASHTVPGTVGELSRFSSIGPTRDGRLKPDLVAPGQVICSTLSGQAPVNAAWSAFASGATCRDDRHGAMSGTSMAAPHVTGAVALLLTRYGQMDAAQVKQALTGAARTDASMGALPNQRWGYGKLDALGAIGGPGQVTPTPTATPRAGPQPTLDHALYLPNVVWRPLPPSSPNLFNITQSGATTYQLVWSTAGAWPIYVVSEATNSTFTNATRFSVRNTSTMTIQKSSFGAWYYRVQACTAFTCSDPSNVQMLQRLPPTPTPRPTPQTRFDPIADSSVLQGQPNRNVGGTSDMLAGYDDSVPLEIVRALIRFDLSRVPPGETITRAELSLYLIERYDYPNRQRPVSIWRTTSDWTEGGVTWNTGPGLGEQIVARTINSSSFNRYNFDVTNVVRNWVNGSVPNYGFTIRGPEESGTDSAWLGFGTKEITNSLYRPYLTIVYGSAAQATEDTVLPEGDRQDDITLPIDLGPRLWEELGRPTKK